MITPGLGVHSIFWLFSLFLLLQLLVYVVFNTTTDMLLDKRCKHPPTFTKNDNFTFFTFFSSVSLLYRLDGTVLNSPGTFRRHLSLMRAASWKGGSSSLFVKTFRLLQRHSPWWGKRQQLGHFKVPRITVSKTLSLTQLGSSNVGGEWRCWMERNSRKWYHGIFDRKQKYVLPLQK